jgi:Protein of unknown function (DUF2934)
LIHDSTGETNMPAKSATSTKTAKAATTPPKRRSTSPRRTAKKRGVGHSQIAERAYFIHLEEGSSDEMANWLRAERELMAA